MLNKPVGLLSQSDHSHEPSLVDHLRQYFGRHYVGLIHRLDRSTSGLIVVAKRSKAAQRLTEALKKGELRRGYLAWVHGNLQDELSETGTKLTHWLLKDELKNKVTAYTESFTEAKKSTLFYVKKANGLCSGNPVSLCSFELETGRSHQIRAQMAAIGSPLVGDKKYGAKDAVASPLLHSAWIEFSHPITKENLSFRSDAPKNWNKYVLTRG